MDGDTNNAVLDGGRPAPSILYTEGVGGSNPSSPNRLTSNLYDPATAPDTVRKTYFIQAKPNGPIKIGVAADPRKRLKALIVGSPVRLEIIGVIAGDMERVIHRQFAHLRMHGEWFRSDQSLLEFIKRQCAPQATPIFKRKRDEVSWYLHKYGYTKEQIELGWAWEVATSPRPLSFPIPLELLDCLAERKLRRDSMMQRRGFSLVVSASPGPGVLLSSPLPSMPGGGAK